MNDVPNHSGLEKPLSAGERQALHYDRILDDYDRHYYDHYSLAYRREFMLDPLLRGVDLNGRSVADLACGGGETSLYLAQRFPEIELTGFDISPGACEKYRTRTNRPCFVLDLTKGYDRAERFDAAIIIGGLHHCIADLPKTMESVTAMLRPGGHFFMFEPNREYFLQFARRLWYSMDKYFDAETEDGLAHDQLVGITKGAFVPQHVTYFGGPAFFLVHDSLVFRIPFGLKRWLAPPLTVAERIYNKLPSRWFFPSFHAHWVRV